MRKMFGLLALGAVVGAPLSAQTTFGVVGGLVSSNFSYGTQTGGDRNSQTGFAAGVSLTMVAGKTFDFAPELMYVQKGAGVTSDGSTVTVKVAYAELPLLFRYNVPSSGSVHPFVIAGPEIAVKTGCSVSATVVTGGSSYSASGDCSTGTYDTQEKSTDYGLMFGAGVSLSKLSVSIRYDIGLADVNGNSDASASEKNAAWLILVGVHF